MIWIWSVLAVVWFVLAVVAVSNASKEAVASSARTGWTSAAIASFVIVFNEIINVVRMF